MATTKKVTHIEGNSGQPTASAPRFAPTPESKAKATQLRLISVILWVLGIGAQVGAIIALLKNVPNLMVWIIALIVVDLILVVIGSQLWKKSNRFDPPSEKNKFMFFLQSQLGLVTAVIAFLPLIIFIIFSKNLDGKQKGILGGIAGIALIIAGISGYDFNPASIEKYTDETQKVEQLMGQNHVYWTAHGTKYHLYDDCSHINSDRTKEIFEGGTVAEAHEHNGRIDGLCSSCEKRAENEKTIDN